MMCAPGPSTSNRAPGIACAITSTTSGGVRPFDDHWWGEGEVKVYFDGETEPTICGTGTEDYLGSVEAFIDRALALR